MINLTALCCLLCLTDLTGPVGDISLRDCRGKQFTTRAWRDHKAVVLVFLNPECPLSNASAPELHRLHRAFAKQGVGFYAVYCDPDLTPAQVARHGKDYAFSFPLLLDPRQQLAQATGATRTPQAVILSPTGKVLYRGRIDDRYTPEGKRRPRASRRDLEVALKEVLAGKTPTISETPVFGCPLPEHSR